MGIQKIGLALFVCAAFAVSGDLLAKPPVSAQTGIVIGGLIGYSTQSNYPENSGKQLTSPAIKHFAWGINGGYDFAFNPHMLGGFELGYNDSGTLDYGPGHITWNDISLLATMAYVNESGLRFFFKGGAARVDQKSTILIFSVNKQYSLLPKAVIGLGYNVEDNIIMSLSYGHIFGGKKQKDATELNKPGSIDRIMLGVSIKIPME